MTFFIFADYYPVQLLCTIFKDFVVDSYLFKFLCRTFFDLMADVLQV